MGGGTGGVPRSVLWVSAGLVVGVVALVTLSLRREPPLAFAPTPPAPAEVGDARVGPTRVTIDATDPDRWTYFDFSRGAVIEDPAPYGWDLAFRRFNIVVNGGPGLEGRAAVRPLDAGALDGLASVPTDGYTTGGADSVNPAIERWYDYSFTSHLLTPRPTAYAVRTADGRYAALRFVSYYCPGARPGCITMEYVYQGDGSARLNAR